MGKTKKIKNVISEEHLESVKSKQVLLNNIVSQIGAIEAQKHALLHNLAEVNKQLEDIKVVPVGTSQQSRDIVVVEFFGGLKIATFHLSCSNTAQKTSERQNIIQRLKNNEFQCAIGDWNTEPDGLNYKDLEILPPSSYTTTNNEKLDYTVINGNCQANGFTTEVLKFHATQTSNHFPIKIEIVLD